MNILRQAAASVGHSGYRSCPSSHGATTAFQCIQQQQQQQKQQQQHRSFALDILIDPAALSRQQQKKSKQSSKSWRPSYRFVDRTRVRVAGGTGGKGSTSCHQLPRKYKIRPDGGHGGNGGSVVIVADPNEQTLKWSHPHAMAENGTNGGNQEKYGRSGKNLILRVPCGVVIRRILNHDEEWDEKAKVVRKRLLAPVPVENEAADETHSLSTDEHEYDVDENDVEDEVEMLRQGLEIDVFPKGRKESDDENDGDYSKPPASGSGRSGSRDTRESVVLADLDSPGSHIMVAHGGRGGVGTCYYAKDHNPLPDMEILSQNATPGLGEVAFLELELKSIADLGLVGFPNAGKSSLLRAMSQAAPEIAPYPFTTLHPIIGCIEYRDGFQIRAADIPGLIGGASEGRGRGHDFLRHIERTKALLYIVDAAGVDFRDPVEDLHVLANELASYGDGSLLDRRAIVVANKIDLLTPERMPEVLAAIGEAAKAIGIDCDQDVIGISAGVTGEGLSGLSQTIRDVVTQSEADRILELESRAS
jgi:GTP-binding protein